MSIYIYVYMFRARLLLIIRRYIQQLVYVMLSSRGQLKCDGTRTETRFRLSAKRTSPFKSAVASVQSTAGSRGVPSAVVMLDTPRSEVA